MSKSKAVTTFDPKSFGMSALDDEDYDIEEGSALDQANVRGNSEPRLRAKKDRFAIVQGKDTIQQFKKGEAVPVVVHAFAPGITQRQYFEGKYDENAEFKPPVCWSQDGKRPDENSTKPQARSCKTCQKGSNGDKTCSFTSKLVVSLKTDEGDTPLLLDLNLNSGSLFSKEESPGKGGLGVNWPHYVRFYKEELDKDMAKFVTLISFNTDNEDEHENQMLFKPLSLLKKGDINWELHDEQDKEDLLERVRIDYSDYEAETEDAGEQELDEEDDDEEEVKPAAKKKRASRRKPEPVVEEDDDDEDDDEEEEEIPIPKKRTKKKAASRRKPAPVVEEDDDDEEEEEEPAPKPKAKKKASAKRRPVPVEEDDDEDEDEEIPLDDLDAALAEFEEEEDEYEDDED